MRPAQGTRDLDAVSRTSLSGGLSVGAINLEVLKVQGRVVPQGFKRYDFLASGGALSEAEARFLTGKREK